MNLPKMIQAKVETSLEKRVIDLVQRDYTMIAGKKVQEMFAKDLVEVVRGNYRQPNMLEVGQMLWIGVDEGDRPSYGKNTSNTRFKPVILTPLAKEDFFSMGNGHSRREVREQQIVRLFTEAKEQGALLTNNDVGVILGVSPATVSKQAREYMEREKVVLPTRGIIHDLGRAVTHKRIIIRLYRKGYHVPEIARRTKHSEQAVNRYIKAFNRVKMLDGKLDLNGIARTLEMSNYLVKEYLNILHQPPGAEPNA